MLSPLVFARKLPRRLFAKFELSVRLTDRPAVVGWLRAG